MNRLPPILIIILPIVLCVTHGLNLPTNLKTCKRNDADLGECLKNAIQDALPKLVNGLPEFKLPPIDPFFVPSMTIGEGAKGAVRVVQNYKDVNLYGCSKAKVEKAKILNSNSSALNFTLDAYMEEFILEGQYNISGNILAIPIVGNGHCKIVLDKVMVGLIFDGEITEKKGKRYMGFKAVKTSLNPGRVQLSLENLFNGNEILSKEMHKILNENWKGFFEDVQKGYEDTIGVIIQSIINNIFLKLPYDDIIPN